MKRNILPFLVLTLVSLSTYAQRITVTVAGNGNFGYTGDNGPAKRASLNAPNDVCIDAAHNLYFTDQSTHMIRKVMSATGVISTIAGGGTGAGDGVPATSVSLTISFLCCDGAGNVYAATGATLRKIDASTGIITTVAGGGTSTADGVPATTVLLTTINGVCADGDGNLYLVVGNLIKKIDASGIITTIAGTGTAGSSGDGGPATLALLSQPKYITIDHSGNVYFGDQNPGIGFSERVRRIDAATGIITAAFGGGSTLYSCLGVDCMIGGLSGMCCDNGGDIIFNEWSCSCRKWDHTSGWVSPVGGDFYYESFKNDTSSDFAYMDNNYGICADEANNYYIADRGNNRIRKIMQLTHAPVFAFGEAQTLNYCGGTTGTLDSMLWVADMDASETETWTVYSAPSAGTLTGFPATAPSNGTFKTTKPVGCTYTPPASFTGMVSFQVKVSDGTSDDIITINVNVLSGTPAITGTDEICTGATTLLTTSVGGGTWSASSSNATVSATGDVTGVTDGPVNIIYTINGSCGTITATHWMNIVSPPVAGTLPDIESICQGTSVLFTGVAPGGVWSVVNPNATVSATGMVTGAYPGTDVIEYSITNACGTSTASRAITIEPAPFAGVVSGGDKVCVHSDIVFASTGTGGVWSTINAYASVNPASGVVTGVLPGVETIIYQVTNSCGTATVMKNVTVYDCTASSLPVVYAEPLISVYPNPASSILNIHTPLNTGAHTITMTDVTGRVVLRSGTRSSSNITELNVSSLNSGIYFVSVLGEESTYVGKVTICK